MKKNTQFSKTVMASVIASATFAGMSAPAFAQEVEEVMVTGVRAALERSMDVKRNSQGVVDAISSEDIGKFPDTNLAESLQRITGVSISRQNGEGSEVTVRGFGPDNNMVTLNGRTMPTGTTYGGGSGADATTRAGGSRAFNFANLASDGISGVDVYKTGRANVATGGIGATIDIKTSRPLDTAGFKGSVGLKALHDTTNRTGEDITPEFSGLVSWSDDSEVFGAALSVSSQKRDSGSAGVTVNNWNIGVWGQDDIYNNSDLSVYENAPANGQLYARPNDFRYAFSDFERERLNSQLTLQYRPVENVTATVDYTYANNDITESRAEVGNWIQNGSNISKVVFDNSRIATPLSVSELYAGTVDIGYENQFRKQRNTLESLGVNLAFQVNDQFKVILDAHDSSLESTPKAPGGAGEIALGMGAPFVTGKTLDFTKSIPTYSYTTSIPNNAITEDQVGSSILRFRGAGSVNDVTQVKLDGMFEFTEGGRLDFGIESRDSEMSSYQTAEVNQALGNWGITNPGEFAGSGLLDQVNIGKIFDDFNLGNSPTIGFQGNAADLTAYAMGLKNPDGSLVYPDASYSVSPILGNDDIVKEEVQAVYFQFGFGGEIGRFPIEVVAGMRYENTDVTSTSRVSAVSELEWQDNNDFSPIRDDSRTEVLLEKSSYDNFLPNLDVKVSLSDDLVLRGAFSNTIARARFDDLRVSPNNFGTTGSTYNGYQPTAAIGSPTLLPLESKNFDLSLEYYYSDVNYVSAGVFEKRVSNFVGTSQEERKFFGVLDQTSPDSPRIRAAVAALETLGLQTDDSNLHAMVVLQAHPEAITNNPAIFPNGAYEGTAAQQKLLGETTGWNVSPQAGDPEMSFLTSVPVNDKEAKLYGAEFAVQHFFGDTGFGVLANYTLVRGDVGFDNEGLPTETQFALTGLSDTANLVLMYENYGFTTRLAYNWRDEFLAEVNQGSSRNPRYVEDYSQIDLTVSYEFAENFIVTAEAINLTGEDSREYNRNSRMIRFADDLGARYALGVRYSF
jgi:TonB-dependent receptor